MSELWSHQQYGINETIRRLLGGQTSVCLTSPTGGGKTRMMVALTEWGLNDLGGVVLYTPRKLLTEQLIRVFKSHEIPFGVRAANFDDDFDLSKPLQISSPATEDARCFKTVRWQPHNAKLVMVDEIHMQKGEVIRKLMQYHRDRGAKIVLVTATPIGVSDLAESLVVAGTTSELRRCGALLPCIVYAPDEIDTSKIGRTKTGEFSYSDVKAVWNTAIFGRVLTHWQRLNPTRKPTILFAPGVAESIWFAEQFLDAGVNAAHIDGEDVWLNGEFYKSNPEIRDRVLKMSQNREIDIVCNRFVMREGIDMPWLEHEILATPIGSMVSYVQTVGRLLRAHPGVEEVILQDHGGNWWRHGSPNMDRDWAAYWELPAHFADANREERIRSKKEAEPIHCPQCDCIRISGDTCPKCGYRHTTKSRIVIQHNGNLKEMTGDIFRPRYTKREANTQDLWNKCYYRTMHARDRDNKTFREAVGLFVHENHYWPPKDLDLMPTNEADWFRAVKDVHRSNLTGVPAEKAKQEPQMSLFQ